MTDTLPITPAGGAPLYSLLTSREEFGGTVDELLSMSAAHGVRRRDLSEGRAPSEDLSGYRRVWRGDIVVNKLSARDGAFGRSPHDGVISPAYWVLKPTDVRTDTRYLHYLLHSDPYLAEMGRLSKFMPPAQFDLAWDQFKWIRVPARSAEEQRRIADFLDDQVARIDQAVVYSRDQVGLAREREEAMLDSQVEELGERFGWAAFGRFVTTIEQGWSPPCASEAAEPGEPAVLKLGAVRDGRFDFRQNKAFLRGTNPVQRYEVRPGDLLISRANTPELVGDVAVVADDVPARLYLPDLLYRVQLRVNDPSFFALALRSRRVRGLLGVIARGTSGSMVKLRGEDLRALQVPVAPASERRQFGELGARSRQLTDSLADSLGARIRLFAERKRSLITAAVTGELDVSASSAYARAAEAVVGG